MDKKQNFSVVQLQQQDVTAVFEDIKTRYDWVPVGILGQDDYFQLITDAFNTSTTTSACVEGIADLIFGKGLYSKNEAFKAILPKLIPQEESKRVAFDLKLYGNGAYQVYWNKEHTKVIKFYHVPVQNLRAEKIYSNPRIENYFYCTDWKDQKAQKHKQKIPVFGTSNENVEILYIKNYSPGHYYYSLPDWIASLQFAYVEADLSNLHLNNIANGFMPVVMVNFNNGVPAPEERQVTENMIEDKFTGSRNAGRFMLSFNDDPALKPTIDVIQTDNLHEKYQYVADYAQDRILVAHRVTSPLLFGIRTANNGFSSQSEEMMTAYSILQTMTINAFQNVLLQAIDGALAEGGWEDSQLFIDQLTPLSILSQTAEDTGQTVEDVQTDVNETMDNPDVTDSNDENKVIEQKVVRPSQAFFKQEYERYED
jgi:hypothetical protein